VKEPTMSKRILVMEDDAELGRVIVTRLRSNGYDAGLVQDALAGVQAAHTQAPDLIVLDLLMPAGGGVSVLKRLRMSERTKSIPVLVLTGLTGSGVRREVFGEGAQGCLHKPYDPEQLLSEVRRLLRDSSASEAA